MDLASIVPVVVLHCAPYVKRCLTACTNPVLQAAAAGKQAARNVLTANLHHNDVAIVDQSPRDSTSCPARSIATTDGVDPSFTLLVQNDLCESMKTAVSIQRLYSKEQRYAKAQLKEIKAFDSKLWQEITVLKKAIRNEENPELKAQWKSRLFELESLLNVAPAKKSNLEARLKYRGKILLKLYEDIGAFLDQAMVEANLADLDYDQELPIEKLDIDEQCLQRIQDQDYADPEYAAELAGPRIPDEYYGAVVEGVAAPQSPWPAEQKAEHADLVGDAQAVEQDAAAIEDEPVKRNNYIRIFPEDLEDYTPGPVRFISATDGYNPVVALLMRHDLAQFIKRTIKLQRMYDQMERQGKLQLEELERYEKELRREIRIRKMAPSEAGSDGELPTAKKELKTLKSLLEVVPVEKELLQNRLRYKGDLLLEANHDVTKFLDEAFVAALLYEPKVDEEEQIEIFNLEERFQTLHAESYPEEAKFLPVQEFEEMRVCDKPAEPTLEETAKHDAMVKLWEARKSLETAQQEFDEKDDRRAWELHQRRTEEMSGEASFDATEEDFDIRWVACNRELTRNLIDAEEFFSAAEAKAVELGCELPQDTEGYYGGEGFIEYYESDHIVDGDFSEDPRVGRWISELPDVLNKDPEAMSEARGEICEWECREVEISDSLSAVDYDCKRSKIDAYEQACRANRE